MPPGGEWPGVYTSRFGELHVAVDGTVGRGFVRATNAVIELSGPIDGDVWLFSWKEQSQVTGETKQGRGYFRYRIIPRALQHELRGGWGLGDGPPANAWDAFKGRAGEAQP
jgi:hypothetical protein